MIAGNLLLCYNVYIQVDYAYSTKIGIIPLN